VVTIVLEEHAASVFRVKMSEVRMQLHREVAKKVVTQIHQRVRVDRTLSRPAVALNKKRKKTALSGTKILIITGGTHKLRERGTGILEHQDTFSCLHGIITHNSTV
jgi:FlaA1/EpsC-like NDP-sugar epimerase